MDNDPLRFIDREWLDYNDGRTAYANGESEPLYGRLARLGYADAMYF